MELVIDKHIPIPEDDLGWKDKLDLLEVGDSLPVLTGSENTVRQMAWKYFHSASAKEKLRKASPGEMPRKFIVRPDPTDADNFRVWRVK